MSQCVEYWIHRDDAAYPDCRGGAEWRYARRLVTECEAGFHPEITVIERVVKTDAWEAEIDHDYETLWRRP